MSKNNPKQCLLFLDTPKKINFSATPNSVSDVESINDDILEELADICWWISDEGLSSMLKSAATESECDDYLKKSKIYDYEKKAWLIPESIDNESRLYTPFVEVIQSVLDHFGHIGRTVVESHNDQLAIDERKDSKPASESTTINTPTCAVDLMVLGSEAEFDYSPATANSYIKDRDRAYTKCLTLFEGKKGNTDSETDLLEQAGNYARSCFNAQRNRTFVYLVMFNESSVRFFYFDHCGAMISDWVSYRSDASVLIRIILLTCNTNSSAVGLDPAVKFRKPSGGDTVNKAYERVFTLNIEDTTMELTATALTSASNAISGRNTNCWRVKDAKGKEYILKECSHLVERQPAEWDLLKDAKGLDGVGQMIGYQVAEKVTEMRTSIGMGSPKEIADRQRYFLLLEAYGLPICNFTSRLQLLEVLRDAIQGHFNLWRRGMLHRDISKNNILIGKPGASEGNRGVVIDMDMAIYTNRDKSLFGTDSRTGTHVFQSVMVLSNNPQTAMYAAPHDYLDDLESFFWVLIWITLGHNVYETPDDFLLEPLANVKRLRTFEMAPDFAIDAKHAIFATVIFLGGGWGNVFFNLVADLQNFLYPRVSKRDRDLRIRAFERNVFKYQQQPLLDPKIQQDALVDYPIFIALFDKAIEEYKKDPFAEPSVLRYDSEPLEPREPEASHPKVSTAEEQVGSGSKRTRRPDDEIDNTQGTKKARFNSGTCGQAGFLRAPSEQAGSTSSHPVSMISDGY